MVREQVRRQQVGNQETAPESLEGLCRYICRPPVAEKRLWLNPNGNVRYELKTPYREATTHVKLIPGFLPSTLRVSLRLFKIAIGDFVSHSALLSNWRPWFHRREPTGLAATEFLRRTVVTGVVPGAAPGKRAGIPGG
jgi:hypothetical protein